MLAVRGGAELVALWAQLASVIELVAGVALAGVAAGVTVQVAQAATKGQEEAALRGALRLGLAASAPVALAVMIAAALQRELSPMLVAFAALAGWLAVMAGVVNSYWLGQQRRGRMLMLAAFTAALALAAALFAPAGQVLEALVLASALPALVALGIPFKGKRDEEDERRLRRYLLPGFVIGICGPASLVIARSAVGETLSWHEAGVLQALWRLADWVCAVAAGVLTLHFLPRFAAARSGAEFSALFAQAAKIVLLPSAAVFVVLYLLQRPLLALLYEPGVSASDAAVGLLLAGSWVRIVAWLPLFALYALRRTRAVAVGELLSLPLFALLVTLSGEHLSLELAGLMWLAAYIAYAGFNFWALNAPRPSFPPRPPRQ